MRIKGRMTSKAEAEPTGNRKARWRQLVQTFGSHLWRYRRRMALAYLLNFMAVAMALLMPWPLQMMIDNVIGQAPLPTWMRDLTTGIETMWLVVPLAAAVVLFAALSAILEGAFKYHIARMREGLSLELRDRLLEHILKVSPAIYCNHRSGELVHRLVNDVDLFTRLQSKTLPMIFKHIATIALILCSMFLVAPLLGLVCLVLLPVLILIMQQYAGRLQTAAREKRRFEGEVAGLAQEIVRGLPTVQSLGGEGYLRNRFRKKNRASLSAGVENARVGIRMERMMKIAQGGVLAFITGMGALFVLQGYLTVGVLTVFVTYIKRLLSPIEKINELASNVVRGLTAGEQMLAALQLPVAVLDAPGAIELPAKAGGHIALREVSFRYPGDEREQPVVLDRVSMDIEPGRLTVLAGASGSGKSTLLSLLLRLYEPDSGEIIVDGHRLDSLSLRSWRAKLSVLLQNTHLFAGSVREALQGEHKGIPEVRLWQALTFVALDADIAALPGGVDAPLGEDGLNLSGGQRKRLALARAFLLDRPILLLDEPLANIDAQSAAVVVSALQALRRNKTCLVITHRRELMLMADTLYLIENGRIRECSPHSLPADGLPESPVIETAWQREVPL